MCMHAHTHLCRCMHIGCVCPCFCSHRGRNSHEGCATNSQPFNVSGSLLVGFQEGLLFWVGGIPIYHGSYVNFPPRFMLDTLTMNCSSLASVPLLLAGLSSTLCSDINVHYQCGLGKEVSLLRMSGAFCAALSTVPQNLRNKHLPSEPLSEVPL